MNKTIAVIGAGVAGLTAARALGRAGHRVVVFDKGRQLGGRCATRQSRTGLAFDHGAQFFTARSRGFQAVVDAAEATGTAARWETGDGRLRFVGVPGMNTLASHLARAIGDVRLGTEVSAVSFQGANWHVRIGADDVPFDAVVLTVPAPQASRLLGDHPLVARLAGVEMAPCLSLMAAFSDGAPPPFSARRDDTGSLQWIAHDGGKPGRQGQATFVAHASVTWSEANLEAEKEEIARMMLPMLASAIEREPGEVIYSAGHRWRYARATTPLGAPYMSDETDTLFIGGDWCLGPRVEAAWESGAEIGAALTLAWA